MMQDLEIRTREAKELVMSKEMHRPCVLPAKLKNLGILTLLGSDFNDPVVFDAFTFEGLKYEPSTSYAPEEYYLVKIYIRPNCAIVRYAPKEGIDVLVRQTNYLIQKALNPPIKVTQAVLKAMEKVPEAKFWVWDDENRYQLNRPSNAYVSLRDSWENGRDCGEDDEGIPCYSRLQIGKDYVQADCPLALQLLLDFNEEGEVFDA